MNLFNLVHIPAEGEPKFVYELAARLLFLTGRGKVEFLASPKIRHTFFYLCKGSVKDFLRSRGSLHQTRKT